MVQTSIYVVGREARATSALALFRRMLRKPCRNHALKNLSVEFGVLPRIGKNCQLE